MIAFSEPFGLGFWVGMFGFAGCLVLIGLSFRTSRPLKAARLIGGAVTGVMALQSIRLLAGISEEVASMPEKAARLGWDYAIGIMRDLPIDALLLWFTAAVFGAATLRLYQLWTPRRVLETFTKLIEDDRGVIAGADPDAVR
jgi:hypothetical protein